MAATRDIKLIIRTEIEQALRDLDKAEKELGDLDKAAGKTNTTFATLAKGVGAFVGALALREVARMGVELAKIGAEANDIAAAFARLPQSTRLLTNLRNAVKGTVPDVELMRSALQGFDLGGTNEQLETFAEFARLESVRKGVDTLEIFRNILGGVFRGSTELLDNFGFSLAAVNGKIEELAAASGKSATSLGVVERRTLLAEAVMQLMTQRMSEAGEIATSRAEQMRQEAANWDNLKTRIGAFVADAGEGLLNFYGDALGAADRFLDVLGVGGAQRVGELNEQFLALREQTAANIEEVGRLRDRYLELTRDGISLTEAEQQELNQTIQRLAEIAPGSAAEIDKYGRVLDVNIASVNAFTEAQQKMIRAMEQERIQQTAGDVRKNLQELREVNQALTEVQIRITALSSGMTVAGTRPLGLITQLQGQVTDLEARSLKAGAAMDGLTLSLNRFFDLTSITPKQLSVELDLSEQEAQALIERFEVLERKKTFQEIQAEVARFNQVLAGAAQETPGLDKLKERTGEIRKALESLTLGSLETDAGEKSLADLRQRVAALAQEINKVKPKIEVTVDVKEQEIRRAREAQLRSAIQAVRDELAGRRQLIGEREALADAEARAELAARERQSSAQFEADLRRAKLSAEQIGRLKAGLEIEADAQTLVKIEAAREAHLRRLIALQKEFAAETPEIDFGDAFTRQEAEVRRAGQRLEEYRRKLDELSGIPLDQTIEFSLEGDGETKMLRAEEASSLLENRLNEVEREAAQAEAGLRTLALAASRYAGLSAATPETLSRELGISAEAAQELARRLAEIRPPDLSQVDTGEQQTKELLRQLQIRRDLEAEYALLSLQTQQSIRREGLNEREALILAETRAEFEIRKRQSEAQLEAELRRAELSAGQIAAVKDGVEIRADAQTQAKIEAAREAHLRRLIALQKEFAGQIPEIDFSGAFTRQQAAVQRAGADLERYRQKLRELSSIPLDQTVEFRLEGEGEARLLRAEDAAAQLQERIRQLEIQAGEAEQGMRDLALAASRYVEAAEATPETLSRELALSAEQAGELSRRLKEIQAPSLEITPISEGEDRDLQQRLEARRKLEVDYAVLTAQSAFAARRIQLQAGFEQELRELQLNEQQRQAILQGAAGEEVGLQGETLATLAALTKNYMQQLEKLRGEELLALERGEAEKRRLRVENAVLSAESELEARLLRLQAGFDEELNALQLSEAEKLAVVSGASLELLGVERSKLEQLQLLQENFRLQFEKTIDQEVKDEQAAAQLKQAARVQFALLAARAELAARRQALAGQFDEELAQLQLSQEQRRQIIAGGSLETLGLEQEAAAQILALREDFFAQLNALEESAGAEQMTNLAFFYEQQLASLYDLISDEKALLDERRENYQRMAQEIAGVLQGPLNNLVADMLTGTERMKDIWAGFILSLKRQIAQFLADRLVTLFFRLLFAGLPGGGAAALLNVVGGGSGAAGLAQRGALVKGSDKGKLYRVGENYTDEVIVPVKHIPKFIEGGYALPGGISIDDLPLPTAPAGGFKVGGLPIPANFSVGSLPAPALPAALQGGAAALAAMAGSGAAQRSKEIIIERTMPVAGRIVVETVAPELARVRDYQVQVNRETNIPDTRRVDELLSTRRSEFDK